MNKVKSLLDDARTYWKIPMRGRYMTFKEIAAYAGGGMGAYFIIVLGSNLLISSTNMIVGNGIGIGFKDMYVMYLIATLANIPLTAVRANMIDNIRGEGGKYRPFLLKMGIPTALIAVAYVWFPYGMFNSIFPGEVSIGVGDPIAKAYIAKCALVMVWNLLLQFYFNFFNDAYTNLIHVLSPNTQERTDVLAIKSVVYSFAPSVLNAILPAIAGVVANNNLYDIRVYRYCYPVFAIIGIGLTIVVYANTSEKIVQAKTHTIQISFIDSFKAVAKNKYFWIIALAGWLGFLEGAYGSIMDWSFSYGHVCSGTTFGAIRLIVGNASLWGMLLAPMCVRKYGKKATLIGINIMNIVCILAIGLNTRSIIWIAFCNYMNYFFGAFEQITTPAIQADIRDYHQYRTGERVDGMFATVTTIGNIVTLVTSLVLPFVYESYGLKEGNGYEHYMDILDVETGDPTLLHKVIVALVIMAAVGAFLNVVPYFFYDLTERQQKSIIQILKIRAMFEDHGNGILNDRDIVETVDIIRRTRILAETEHKEEDKSAYKSIKDKKKRKEAKKYYQACKEFNEKIEIAKLVNKELNKFQNEFYQIQVQANQDVYEAGLQGLVAMSYDELKKELALAKAMSKETEEEKELRKFKIEIAKKKMSVCSAIARYYADPTTFVQPDYAVLDALFEEENKLDEEIAVLVEKLNETKKDHGSKEVLKAIKEEIKKVQASKKANQKVQKAEMDKHARFARAAKPYLDAEKLMRQKEDYTHLDEIEAVYDEAKARYEAKLADDEARALAEAKADAEYKEMIKAQKKMNKKK